MINCARGALMRKHMMYLASLKVVSLRPNVLVSSCITMRSLSIREIVMAISIV